MARKSTVDLAAMKSYVGEQVPYDAAAVEAYHAGTGPRGDIAGFHNQGFAQAAERLRQGRTYRDCSTVCVTPAIAPIPPRVVQCWMNLMKPMNQKFTHLMLENYEVGNAFSVALDFIKSNELKHWKYLLTLETDNMPPPDGVIRLIEDIESGPYDAVGSLYWTKGPDGQPMCYGDPNVVPRNYVPWRPPLDSVTPCNGLGMGFTLFRLSSLLDDRLPSPLFKTIQEFVPQVGARAFTQDLAAFEEMNKVGMKVACSTRVLTGHYDYQADMVW